ncbi:unnamed protein product [marine sediment metagenome]|uniref:Uncharacterized protein n=1 Tax=marine sediment metagenome TaxID=412755 RepID=X0SZL6_9ZZZZ
MSNSRKQHSRSSGRKTRRSPRSKGRGSGRNRSRRRRWLLLPLGLGIAAVALYVLVSMGAGGPVASGPPPLDDIGDASRVRLERVLLDAERGEERAR